MIAPNAKVFSHGELIVRIVRSGESGLVTWLGSSDARNASEVLEPLIDMVVETMRGGRVTLDFTRLDFMNSSTVVPIITLVKKLDETGIESLLLFIENNWQRTHLRCLKTIARSLTNVTVEGR